MVVPSVVMSYRPFGNFIELNRTVTRMVLKANANDRRTSSPLPRCGPRSDYVRQVACEEVEGQELRNLEQKLSCVPGVSGKSALAHFRLSIGHDSLKFHLYRIGIADSPACTLTQFTASKHIYFPSSPLKQRYRFANVRKTSERIAGSPFSQPLKRPPAMIHSPHLMTQNGVPVHVSSLTRIELNNHDVQELWFQQDGATCHTARGTIDLLKDTFGDSLISRFGPVNWPPRSCDLTPLDYFLWGYVKSLVYADKPQTLDHLEDNIHRVIADIRPQMLEKVIENGTSRLDYIRASRGSHMP
ncbi:uncharacterized protein TNCV_1861631 [Trichonephila clavipes]|nr:uncharacterized protein TNCV_1861631 [Trichonephila clavipes]